MFAYAAFVFIGVSLGAGGVLLLAQMNDYGVDRATIGITFFTGSAGFVLASLSNGLLLHRLGVRISLAVGGGAYVLASLCLAARPPFTAFVAVQLLTGYGTGVLESVLTTYLATTSAALVALGFFLGPVFPTTMSIAPQLTTPELAPTAIGVLNAGSAIGGAGLPWVAGAIAQATGIWTLMPYTVALAVVQIAVWRPLAARIRVAPADPGTGPAEPVGELSPPVL